MTVSEAKQALGNVRRALEACEIEVARLSAGGEGDAHEVAAALVAERTAREILSARLASATQALAEAESAERDRVAAEVDAARAALDAPLRAGDEEINAFVRAFYGELGVRVAALRDAVAAANATAGKLPWSHGGLPDRYGRSAYEVAAARHTTWADAAPGLAARLALVVNEEPLSVTQGRAAQALFSGIARVSGAQVRAAQDAQRAQLTALRETDPAKAEYLDVLLNGRK